jgi:hypothetical protein
MPTSSPGCESAVAAEQTNLCLNAVLFRLAGWLAYRLRFRKLRNLLCFWCLRGLRGFRFIPVSLCRNRRWMGCGGLSPSWSPASSFGSGRATGFCGTRHFRGCARTCHRLPSFACAESGALCWDSVELPTAIEVIAVGRWFFGRSPEAAAREFWPKARALKNEPSSERGPSSVVDFFRDGCLDPRSWTACD